MIVDLVPNLVILLAETKQRELNKKLLYNLISLIKLNID